MLFVGFFHFFLFFHFFARKDASINARSMNEMSEAKINNRWVGTCSYSPSLLLFAFFFTGRAKAYSTQCRQVQMWLAFDGWQFCCSRCQTSSHMTPNAMDSINMLACLLVDGTSTNGTSFYGTSLQFVAKNTNSFSKMFSIDWKTSPTHTRTINANRVQEISKCNNLILSKKYTHQNRHLTSLLT